MKVNIGLFLGFLERLESHQVRLGVLHAVLAFSQRLGLGGPAANIRNDRKKWILEGGEHLPLLLDLLILVRRRFGVLSDSGMGGLVHTLQLKKTFSLLGYAILILQM